VCIVPIVVARHQPVPCLPTNTLALWGSARRQVSRFGHSPITPETTVDLQAVLTQWVQTSGQQLTHPVQWLHGVLHHLTPSGLVGMALVMQVLQAPKIIQAWVTRPTRQRS
jgi:hypothetical protein